MVHRSSNEWSLTWGIQFGIFFVKYRIDMCVSWLLSLEYSNEISIVLVFEMNTRPKSFHSKISYVKGLISIKEKIHFDLRGPVRCPGLPLWKLAQRQEYFKKKERDYNNRIRPRVLFSEIKINACNDHQHSPSTIRHSPFIQWAGHKNTICVLKLKC